MSFNENCDDLLVSTDELKSFLTIVDPSKDDLIRLVKSLKFNFNVSCNVFFDSDDFTILEIYSGLFKDTIKNNYDYLLIVVNNIIESKTEYEKKDYFLRQAIKDSLSEVVKVYGRTDFTISIGRYNGS